MNTPFYGNPGREQVGFDLGQLKQLTTEQYDKTRETTIERIKRRIDDNDFKRELALLRTIHDLT